MTDDELDGRVDGFILGVLSGWGSIALAILLNNC